MRKYIYKICTLTEWNNFKKNKKFFGSKKDLVDGYIHLSNKNQIKATLNKYYFNKDKLILLKVETAGLKNLIWEKSTEGKLFPHLYSYLTLKKIKKIFQLSLKKNGFHYLSESKLLGFMR